MNDKPFKAVVLLSFTYNYQINHLVSANVRADAGDTLFITFKLDRTPNGNVITPECETRRLSIPETTELLQWAYHLPKFFEQLASLAQFTHPFFKV